jgi:hypothetical protein
MTDTKQDPPEALAARILVDAICGLIRDHDAQARQALEATIERWADNCGKALNERDDARRQLAIERATITALIAAAYPDLTVDELDMDWREAAATIQTLHTERDDARRQLAAVRAWFAAAQDTWRSKPPDARPWWYVQLEEALAAQRTAPSSNDAAQAKAEAEAAEYRERVRQLYKAAKPPEPDGASLEVRVATLEDTVAMLIQLIRAAEKWGAVLEGKDGSE